LSSVKGTDFLVYWFDGLLGFFSWERDSFLIEERDFFLGSGILSRGLHLSTLSAGFYPHDG